MSIAHAKPELQVTLAGDYVLIFKCHVTIADAVHYFQFCGGTNGGGSHQLLFLMYGELKMACDSKFPMSCDNCRYSAFLLVQGGGCMHLFLYLMYGELDTGRYSYLPKLLQRRK